MTQDKRHTTQANTFIFCKYFIMKTFLIIIINLLFVSFANGQKNGLCSKEINEAYTWQTATTQQIDSFYFNLIPLQQINYPLHIRISISGQIIDLYSLDNLSYNGFLINQTTEYQTKKSSSISQEYQYFFEKKSLDSVRVKNVIHHIITSGLLEFPTDTLISNWNFMICDCSSIRFQSTINNQYSNQEYYCPWSQNGSMREKKIILEVYDLLKKEFYLDSLYKIFTSKLSGGREYSKDGHIMMYKWTKEESENWEKNRPRRDYLDSIQDTIINYLKIETEKQKIELKEIDCVEDYYMIFDKSGKFKKVENHTKYKLRDGYSISELIEAKQEVKKCKKKMKEIFSQINLSSMDLKYDIFVRCNFDFEKKIRYEKIY